jgi:hypothetical protein
VIKVKTHVPFTFISTHKDLYIIRRIIKKEKILVAEEMPLLDLFFPADLGPLAAQVYQTMIPIAYRVEDFGIEDVAEIAEPIADVGKEPIAVENTVEPTKETQETPEPEMIEKPQLEPVPLGILDINSPDTLAPAAIV